ncbi:MAG TPA: ATPase, T2SS/T4P/T4SS family [Bacilli bacterium]|nr:ATPase, T2SS/T4P/T4SS family [Bacilli bacterium]
MNENEKKLLEYIFSSPLKTLLEDDDVTDISYNGSSVFFFTHTQGRKKSDIKFSHSEANDFIRQIANLNNVLFSTAKPIMDTSIANLRISAIHDSLARKNGEKVIHFSIRKHNQKIIDFRQTETGNQLLYDLLSAYLQCNLSMAISGKAGSGKTEMQKFILTLLPNNERVILIDSVDEIEENNQYDLDLSVWRVSDNDEVRIQELIRASLRQNPDWIILAEARGREMKDIISSIRSGHPSIFTCHSLKAELTPYRVLELMGDHDSIDSSKSKIEDITNHIPLYIHMEKRITNEGIVRQITQVVIYEHSVPYLIYQKKDKPFYYPLPLDFAKMIEEINSNLYKTWKEKQND